MGAIMGISFAYTGSAREDLLELLTPIVIDTNLRLEESALAALCMGFVFMSTCNEDVANAIMQGIMERDPKDLEAPIAIFFALGLGLTFLGQQDKIDATLQATNIIEGPLAKFMDICLKMCGYAGSGNVLKIQEMLHIAAEQLKEKESNIHQMVSVLAVGVIAIGEQIGTGMCLRMMNHLLQYGEAHIRKIVPLTIALLNISNPAITIMDTLAKLAYDNDMQVAQSAIFSLGLIGAGTNNSRLAEILRQLASYYTKDADPLFLIRISQGLLHMGKVIIFHQNINVSSCRDF